ncbi:hypothetical protein M885DRAFT_552274 [Pelagophyceae sp. CCMP2097]|nr:hypothetical protein M885DRAFT_552274 [Pelagophyceae sp. CCMP2097]
MGQEQIAPQSPGETGNGMRLRLGESATLDVVRVADFVLLEASIEAKHAADVAALEAQRTADLATLDAGRDANFRLASCQASIERHRAESPKALTDTAPRALLEARPLAALADLAALGAVRLADSKNATDSSLSTLDGTSSPRRSDSGGRLRAMSEAITAAEAATIEAQRLADAATLAASIEAKRFAELATIEATRLADAATLEAQRLAEVATERDAEFEALEAQRLTELATLEAKRLSDLAALEAVRVADLASIEAEREAEVAALEAKRLADLVTLEATIEAENMEELAALEARRVADLAALERRTAVATVEARLAERHISDTYDSHEPKNRLIALDELCSGEGDVPVAAVRALIAEGLETIATRSVVLQLASETYVAAPAALDVDALVGTRLRRYRGASRDAGDAAPAPPPAHVAPEMAPTEPLLLDRQLVTIVVDCLLSNAFKHGGADTAPRVNVHLTDAADGVDARIEVRNAPGPAHAELVALAASSRAAGAAWPGGLPGGLPEGESFATACASARLLGGTLKLEFAPREVVATLTLPGVRRVPPRGAVTQRRPRTASLVDAIHAMRTAIVDDSRINCRMLERVARNAFPAAATTPVVAGSTLSSIEGFAQRVFDEDSDVVLVDQNFGSVCQTLFGTDLVRHIREVDRDRRRKPPRCIYVVSANHTPADIASYIEAGADGHILKNVTSDRLREIIGERCAHHSRRHSAAPAAAQKE